MKKKYRIVSDRWLGFEVQWRYWWMPFWVQAGFSNTHSTLEQAERYAERHARPCVKHLGYL